MSEKIPVRVVANAEGGFFRIGRHWPRTKTETEVTREELEILIAEPKLSVVVLNGEVEGGDEAAAELARVIKRAEAAEAKVAELEAKLAKGTEKTDEKAPKGEKAGK